MADWLRKVVFEDVGLGEKLLHATLWTTQRCAERERAWATLKREILDLANQDKTALVNKVLASPDLRHDPDVAEALKLKESNPPVAGTEVKFAEGEWKDKDQGRYRTLWLRGAGTPVSGAVVSTLERAVTWSTQPSYYRPGLLLVLPTNVEASRPLRADKPVAEDASRLERIQQALEENVLEMSRVLKAQPSQSEPTPSWSQGQAAPTRTGGVSPRRSGYPPEGDMPHAASADGARGAPSVDVQALRNDINKLLEQMNELKSSVASRFEQLGDTLRQDGLNREALEFAADAKALSDTSPWTDWAAAADRARGILTRAGKQPPAAWDEQATLKELDDPHSFVRCQALRSLGDHFAAPVDALPGAFGQFHQRLTRRIEAERKRFHLFLDEVTAFEPLANHRDYPAISAVFDSLDQAFTAAGSDGVGFNRGLVDALVKAYEEAAEPESSGASLMKPLLALLKRQGVSLDEGLAPRIEGKTIDQMTESADRELVTKFAAKEGFSDPRRACVARVKRQRWMGPGGEQLFEPRFSFVKQTGVC